MSEDKFIKIAATYEIFKKIDAKRNMSNRSNSKQIAVNIEDGKYNELDNLSKHIIKRSPSYKHTIKKVISLMREYNFVGDPSVQSNYYIEGSDKSNFDLLHKYVNLFTHTLNVAYEILQFNEKGNIVGINVLNALLHDFGKSSKIRELYPTLSSLSHEKVSAVFAKDFLTKELVNGNREINKETVGLIEGTIKVQHSPVRNKNIFLKTLIEADFRARENEIMFIKNKIKKMSHHAS